MDREFLRRNFRCKRCGKCCQWQGFVKISDAELDAIADFLSMSPETFADRYTRLLPSRNGLSLIDGENGACVFYNAEKGCLIQPVKPRQCGGFPYNWNNPGWEDVCEGAKTLKQMKNKK